jgi:hypothetical protein
MTDAKQGNGGDPPTRAGAVAAGWRFAVKTPGDSFVLRHSGLEQGRWRVVSQHDRIGFAVEAYKTARELARFGALAIWTNGRVDRFDEISIERRTDEREP